VPNLELLLVVLLYCNYCWQGWTIAASNLTLASKCLSKTFLWLQTPSPTWKLCTLLKNSNAQKLWLHITWYTQLYWTMPCCHVVLSYMQTAVL